MVLASPGFKMPALRSLRLRPRLLEQSKWRKFAFLCFTFPVLVTLKRFAALRFVLNFAIA